MKCYLREIRRVPAIFVLKFMEMNSPRITQLFSNLVSTCYIVSKFVMEMPEKFLASVEWCASIHFRLFSFSIINNYYPSQTNRASLPIPIETFIQRALHSPLLFADNIYWISEKSVDFKILYTLLTGKEAFKNCNMSMIDAFSTFRRFIVTSVRMFLGRFL